MRWEDLQQGAMFSYLPREQQVSRGRIARNVYLINNKYCVVLVSKARE